MGYPVCTVRFLNVCSSGRAVANRQIMDLGSRGPGIVKCSRDMHIHNILFLDQRLYMFESGSLAKIWSNACTYLRACAYLEIRLYMFESLLLLDQRFDMFESRGLAKIWSNTCAYLRARTYVELRMYIFESFLFLDQRTKPRWHSNNSSSGSSSSMAAPAAIVAPAGKLEDWQ